MRSKPRRSPVPDLTGAVPTREEAMSDKWMRESNEPDDAVDQAVYWADLAVKQAQKSVRSAAIAYRLAMLSVALLVLSLVLRVVLH